MLRDPVVGDWVNSIYSFRPGVIQTVNHHFGNVQVKYIDGYTKNYTLMREGCLSLRRLTSQEKADLILKLENAGITDFWSN